MLAARTGAAGSQISEDNSKFRKQSGLSSGGKDRSPKKAPENAKDSSLSPTGQSQLRARQLALLREVEMNWYLKLCELSSEHTTAHTTGMPHRWARSDGDIIRADGIWRAGALRSFPGSEIVVAALTASLGASEPAQQKAGTWCNDKQSSLNWDSENILWKATNELSGWESIFFFL